MHIVNKVSTVVKEDVILVDKQIIIITYREEYDMAMATYNATLEYDKTNTVEIKVKDELGNAVQLIGTAADYSFNIARADNLSASWPSACQSTAEQLADGHLVFVVTPPSGTLMVASDVSNDYDNDTYEHIYTIRGTSHVYVRGKLNLVIAA